MGEKRSKLFLFSGGIQNKGKYWKEKISFSSTISKFLFFLA